MLVGVSSVCPSPKALAVQGFASHAGVLATEGKIVRYHGDEFTIGGLALDIADRVAEELLQRLDVAPVPGHLNGVADGPLYPGRGGVELLGHLPGVHRLSAGKAVIWSKRP